MLWSTFHIQSCYICYISWNLLLLVDISSSEQEFYVSQLFNVKHNPFSDQPSRQNLIPTKWMILSNYYVTDCHNDNYTYGNSIRQKKMNFDSFGCSKDCIINNSNYYCGGFNAGETKHDLCTMIVVQKIVNVSMQKIKEKCTNINYNDSTSIVASYDMHKNGFNCNISRCIIEPISIMNYTVLFT